ncbi:MAG: ATP-binding protein [Defluviitaleaceae bacterium]|nr:ATP-binding protein [Defluviitaleaceae bacterium]
MVYRKQNNEVFNEVLIKISKMPKFSAGILYEAIKIIAEEGCHALHTTRISIWEISSDESHLKNLEYYDIETHEHSIQENFCPYTCQEYINLLKSERLIVINDIRIQNPFWDSMDEHDSKICAILNAPIRVEGKLVGVVCIEQDICDQYQNKREWTYAEQNFASSLADFMSLALINAEKHALTNRLEGFYTDIPEQEKLDTAKLASQPKPDFLANISHEIRTPLNAILGLTDLTLRIIDTPEAIEYLNNVKRAGAQLLSIINDILDFSKIEAGEFEIIPEKYNVHAMISDVVSMIYVYIGNKPIEFIIDDDPDLPYEMIGDVVRIKQIIINLLTNAVKFTKEGYITLSVSSKKTYEDENECVLNIAVEDTGIGIRKADIPSLYSNFTQLDTRKNRSIEGTGLGLSITKNLVELMNGEIFVESTYGKGSCFSLYIIQKISNPAPLRLQTAINGKTTPNIAILFSDSKKSNVLANKLIKMGAACDIIETHQTDLRKYSHIFFDDWQNKIIQNDDPQMPIPLPIFHDLKNNKVSIPLTNISILRMLGYDSHALMPTNHNIIQNQNLRLKNTKILVVDDIDINLLIVEELLHIHGADVDTALSGIQALELMANNVYDLIFMDHMMPDLDGLDTTSIIRAYPFESHQNVPIVALTANVVGDVHSMFLEHGMNDYLSKPINYSELERVLKQWLPQEKLG